MKLHATQQIKTEVDGSRFPLRREYERCNRTLEGRREFYNDLRPASKELAKLDYSSKAECNRMMRYENPEFDPTELNTHLHKMPNPDQVGNVDAASSTDDQQQQSGAYAPADIGGAPPVPDQIEPSGLDGSQELGRAAAPPPGGGFRKRSQQVLQH